MGEKRVVVEKRNKSGGVKKEKKKKRSCCLTCFLVFLIATVVILAAGVGVGCYFGNVYTTQNLDMTIGECFGVVSGLYSPDEKKIVTNPYGQDDLDGFYNELKHAVFLKESTEIDLKEILKVAGSSLGGKESLRLAENAEGGEEAGEGDGGDNLLTRFLTGLIKRENIDFDRISKYDEAKHDEYMMKLSDKELAAFVNEILNTLLEDEELQKELGGKIFESLDLSEYGIDNVGKYISLRQMNLSREERDVFVTDEAGETSKEKKEVTMLSLTVQVKLMDAAKPVLEKYIENKFLASTAHFFVKALLPNNIYVTVGLGLDHETDLDIKLNRIDDEEKVALTFKLIEGVTGSSLRDDLRQMLHESVYDGFLSVANDFVDFSAVKDGTLTVDAFETAIAASHINEEADPENRLTSKDVLVVLRDVLGSDFDAAVSPEHTYKNQYAGEATDVQYNAAYGTVYNPAVKDEEKLVDYEKEFLKEISEKYLIDLDPDGKPDSGDEIDFADFMAMFGIGSSDKSLELTELINGNKMNDLLDRDPSEIRVKINDRMMGAIVSSLLDNILGGEFSTYDVDVEQIIISTKTASEGERKFMEIGISAGLGSFTDSFEQAMLSAMLNEFLPERIMLSVKLDITREEMLGGRQLEKTEIRFNELDAAETEKILKVIGKFAGSLEIDSILSDIEAPLREMLDTMYSTLDSIEFVDSHIILPDIFTTVSDMLFKDEESGENIVSGEEIRDMLEGLSGSDEEDFVASLGVETASDNYDGFVREINDRYYLKTDGALVDKFDDIFAIVDIAAFDSEKFELDRLKHDARPASELRPLISDAELAHIFAEKMADNEALSGIDVNIVGIHVGTDGGESGDRRFIRLAIEFSLSSLGGNVASILPIEKIYIVATSYVDGKLSDGAEEYYETEININKMTEAQKATLQKMMNHLQGADALDFDEKAIEIGKVVCLQLSTLETSLGEDGFEFAEGGIKLTDFYSFLARATETDADSETLKGAVQGLYERESADSSLYNYVSSDIVRNGLGELDRADPMNNFEERPTVENGGKAKMADNKFGALLESKFTDTVGDLSELTIISSASDTSKTKAYYDEMKELGVVSPDGKNYMRIVVLIELKKFMGESGSSLIASFLPEYIYATLYVTLDEPEMSLAAMRINSLSVTEQKALLAIAHLDDDSISATVNDSLAIVSEYHENALYIDSSAGVGAIFTDAALLVSGSTLSEAA